MLLGYLGHLLSDEAAACSWSQRFWSKRNVLLVCVKMYCELRWLGCSRREWRGDKDLLSGLQGVLIVEAFDKSVLVSHLALADVEVHFHS